MNVLLLQLDGKLPNLALMRLAAHYKAEGDLVTFRHVGNAPAVERVLWEPEFDRVYGSAIFQDSQPLAARVREIYPDAILGGTGLDERPRPPITLEDIGITTQALDYSLYPRYRHSLGFTQRGCRLACWFCVVPKKEGKVREVATVADIWRGEPHPRNLVLLDNDFFGQPSWRDRIAEISDGGFRVSFTQGINARMLNDETAAAIASVKYSDDDFKRPRIYTAWDSSGDERPLFRGLRALVGAGVKPDHIMVYMLCDYGYDPERAVDDWDYRRAALRAFGARPYPMPYVRTDEAVGFQRWVIGAYDKTVPWSAWVRANYQPAQLGRRDGMPLLDP